jgi:phage terminase large subunit-like protein
MAKGRQQKTTSRLVDEREEHRLKAEASLEYFINLVHPRRLLGNIHREIINWWTRHDCKSHQLLLLPRDHGKSAMIAYRVVWELTKDPTLKILYISANSNLATKQLKFIKDILTCDTYRLFWPEMVNKDEFKREKWTEREISVDHPKRKEENVRDPSIFTAGLTSNIIGLHCDIAVLDDVVVTGNAYTEEGRDKTEGQYSHLSSIEGSVNPREWVVGTRYHPNDLYSKLIQMTVDKFNEDGDVIRREELFEVFERAVESIGDGTGQFLWPKQQSTYGKWYGFDREILATKRGQYINQVHFRAQYYNDPHDTGSSPIKRDNFQYYDPVFLAKKDIHWVFKNNRLNVVAAVDFAYTTGLKSDYTCIVVVGVDGDQNYYVLDIERFKTDKISEYFNRILKLYEKWGFRKIRTEVTAAQIAIVNDLKNSYIRPLGLSLAVEEYRPSRVQGNKEERILSTLEPKYANKQIWHYPGGNCQVLEEELIFSNPAHDDVKDALAAAIDFAQGMSPLNIFRTIKKAMPSFNFHGKFGGVS